MDISTLRQQILLSNKTASEKAEDFLLERALSVMTLDEWRIFVAEIPEDVKRETVKLMPQGTQLHLHICLIVLGQQLALQHHLVSQ